MIIQPGQGLGFTTSKQIAFGLGTPFTVIIVIVTGKSKYHLLSDFDIQAALKDDKDLTEILIMIIETGILD